MWPFDLLGLGDFLVGAERLEGTWCSSVSIRVVGLDVWGQLPELSFAGKLLDHHWFPFLKLL